MGRGRRSRVSSFPTYFRSRHLIEWPRFYEENAFWAILTAAFTPIPYKVFTVAAGVCEVSFWTLVVASAVGRSTRFFLVGGAVYLLGPHVKVWIEKYFDWLAWGLLVLGVGGFVALKYLR